MPLTVSDIKTARSILQQLINLCNKGNSIEHDKEEFYAVNCINIVGLKGDGTCESLYTCIFEMTPAQREMWQTYKTYLRIKSFTKQVPGQGITLIGWE